MWFIHTVRCCSVSVQEWSFICINSPLSYLPWKVATSSIYDPTNIYIHSSVRRGSRKRFSPTANVLQWIPPKLQLNVAGCRCRMCQGKWDWWTRIGKGATVHWEREKCEIKASKDSFKNTVWKKKHGCRDFRSLLSDLSFIFVYLLIIKFSVTWLGTADENQQLQ